MSTEKIHYASLKTSRTGKSYAKINIFGHLTTEEKSLET